MLWKKLRMKKKKEISKDESFKISEEVQKITDKLIEKIDHLFTEKEKIFLRYNDFKSKL